MDEQFLHNNTVLAGLTVKPGSSYVVAERPYHAKYTHTITHVAHIKIIKITIDWFTSVHIELLLFCHWSWGQ